MNETLQKAVAVMIEKAISGIDTATNFLAAEIPDVIHQLLVWHIVKGGVLAIMSAVAITTIIMLMVKLYNKVERDRGDHFVTFMVSVPAIGVITAFLCIGVPASLQVLQIWIAPKVWLIEYAAELVK